MEESRKERAWPAWGGGKAQDSRRVGHSLMAALCLLRRAQRVVSWRGGQYGGRSESPCFVLQLQNLGWSGLKSALLPPPLSPPCCPKKSSGVTASRCGLELFQVDQGCRGSSQAPGFSSSLLLQWGLPDAFPPLLSFHH